MFGARVIIACDDCSLRREYATEELRQLFPATYWMAHLRYDLARCPRRRRLRECKVRYVRNDEGD
jgi:hypothetical protein